ncbi:transglutaminase family protein [Alteraurantiacibacter aestuarii]|uniref:Transglutaminase family protein n=1 Tax=Alteraurantiacibacter aestuarii TaxID=650004 RepID=A0A844ZM32_9SPHN|nr:transglutaminase family protein [Alteraurantiacibacter aestuarii]MXO88818.1 transglutaminase family protein [Alteraurantiacibacter aestuarii]
MPITINSRFSFFLNQPSDALLHFEAAMIPEQDILSCDTQMGEAMHFARVPAQDNIGERIWIRSEGYFEVAYSASVEVNRQVPDIAGLGAILPHDLPGDCVKYLFDSRYCQGDRLHSFVYDNFGELTGGEKVAAIRDWISREMVYEPGSSDARTTAIDSFVERRGICRDFAHVLIALCRAATIPARYVSCYAPGVNPPDFHAVAEVFLADPTVPGGGAWYMVDATGMADPAKAVKIGVGRDAADVSFLTIFGPAQFNMSEVQVSETPAT